MFALNEKVVYPGHGVAKVSRIIKKQVSGCDLTFYEFVILNNNSTVLIPIDRLADIGIYPVTAQRVDNLFKILAKPFRKRFSEIPTANWSKKSKFYLGGLRTGNIEAVCDIYKDLMFDAANKDLSYSEKNLLQKTENLLVEEIIAATGITDNDARDRLRTITRKAVSYSGVL